MPVVGGIHATGLAGTNGGTFHLGNSPYTAANSALLRRQRLDRPGRAQRHQPARAYTGIYAAGLVNDTGANTLSGPATLTQAVANVSVTNGTTLTLSGTVGQSAGVTGGLAKVTANGPANGSTGAGTVVRPGANTYAGGTNVSVGMVAANSAPTLSGTTLLVSIATGNQTWNPAGQYVAKVTSIITNDQLVMVGPDDRLDGRLAVRRQHRVGGGRHADGRLAAAAGRGGRGAADAGPPPSASRLSGRSFDTRTGLPIRVGSPVSLTGGGNAGQMTLPAMAAGGRTCLGSHRVSNRWRTPTRSSSLPATKSTTSSTVVGFR